MERFPTPPGNRRTGFHYYPDALHYKESDLAAWLPELQALGAGWLTLMAPQNRAVPEGFLRGLLSAGIEPVLHFHLPAGSPASTGSQAGDLRLLFEIYAQWGVHYMALFDRPNLRSAWSTPAWSQRDLVERFLDGYLPLAEAAQESGLIPVFPPLEPGGDYWDTAFLRLALQGIQRRGRPGLLDRLVLGAYAWTGGRPLDWGAGGPEHWPAAHPYETPAGSQDQRGFRIFDWYLTLAQAVLHEPCPLLIIGGGSRLSELRKDSSRDPAQSLAEHTRLNLAVAALMAPQDAERVEDGNCDRVYDPLDGDALEPAPAAVLACNFWLLAASPGSAYAAEAWFQPEGETLPIVDALKQRVANGNWQLANGKGQGVKGEGVLPFSSEQLPPEGNHGSSTDRTKPIGHYLLLPSYEWGVSDWHLDVIRPFVKKYHPVVGFSLEEAMYARRVTVVGGVQSFPEKGLQRLRQSGCIVQQICGNGTDIASQLARM